MFTDVKRWQKIRRRAFGGKTSKRQIIREEGIAWHTLTKILQHDLPPGYTQRNVRRRPKLEAYLPIIHQILEDDRKVPEKQRHTAWQIYKKLREDCEFSGGYTIVKDAVRAWKQDDPASPTQPSQEDVWRDVLNAIASATVNDARAIIAAISSTNSSCPKHQYVRELRQILVGLGFNVSANQVDPTMTEHQWLLDVMQGAISLQAIRDDIGDEDCLAELVSMAQGSLRVRNRAIAVLARMKGISLRSAGRFLRIGPNTVLSYQQRFRERGLEGIAKTRRLEQQRKVERKDIRDAVFSVLHSPPREHNINRTSWKLDDLKATLLDKGVLLSRDSIRKIIKSAGYKWRKAKLVLTSPDPQYREKLQQIQSDLFRRKWHRLGQFELTVSTVSNDKVL